LFLLCGEAVHFRARAAECKAPAERAIGRGGPDRLRCAIHDSDRRRLVRGTTWAAAISTLFWLAILAALIWL
jgi:hypothetical protein